MKEIFWGEATMKKFKFQLFFTICVMFAFAGISNKEVSARKIKIKVEKTGPYAEKIGDEMFAYAKKETRRELKNYWKNKDEDYGDLSIFFGMDVTKKDTFTLCKPYVTWRDEEPQQPMYRFPVVVKGKVVGLLTVSGRMKKPKYLTAMMIASSGMVEEIERLNKLDYLHKNYVFFGYKDIVLAQGEDGKIKKFLVYPGAYRDPNIKPSDAEKFFRALDYDKKLELLLDKMDNFAYTEEEEARMDALIDGTVIEDTSPPSTFIPREATPEPDTSTKENFDNFDSILPVVAVSVIVTVLVIVFVIVKIKKLRDK